MTARPSPRLSGYIRSAGFTIVETVVAILVIAVGVVGVAALYSDRVERTEESTPQVQAAALAEEIAKEIRANPEGQAGYAGAMGVVCSGPKKKNPQDAAAREAACWEDKVEKRLPNGLGTIRRDLTTTPLTYVISVSWSSPETGAASYVVRVQSTKR